jgi:AcrR family transcriptional regulator
MGRRMNNQRTQATQKKIQDALLEKLDTKSIHQISVQEVCRSAHVHRTTFYAHYDDLYDLMSSLEVEMENGISELFLQPDSGLYRSLSAASLEKLIDYVRENASFYRVYLNDFGRVKTFDEHVRAAWKEEIEPVLRKGTNVSEVELRYQFEYFNSGLHGVIRKWLNTNCQESTAELIKVLMHCVRI